MKFFHRTASAFLPIFLCGHLIAQTTLLGYTASSNTANNLVPPLPAFNTTVYRELGSNANWANVETSSGVYNWSHVDNTANHVIAAGVNIILFQLWQTPTWASSNPGDTNCNATVNGFPGSCDPPSDLNSDGTGTNAHFKSYATALMTHALANWPGIKRVYELWNEPSAGQAEWTGTNAQLVRMQTDAIAIRNSIDPGGLICSSSFAGLWAGSGQTAYNAFLTAGGASGVDIIGFHGYVQNGTGGNNPTDVLTVVLAYIRGVKASHGLTGKLANTEFSWLVTSNFSGDKIAFVGQSILVQQQTDLYLMNWYSYNFPAGLLATAVEGSTLAPAGIAFQQLVNFWLKPGTSMAQPCTQSGALWTCKGWTPTISGNTNPYLIVFDTASNHSQTFSGYYTDFWDLTGKDTVIASPQNPSVMVGPEPIMLTPGVSVVPPPPGSPWWWKLCHCGKTH